jgi:hypothetical protein
MSAHILFRANDILVTPAMARFGAVSYQMNTISSVAVYHKPKLNPIAVTLAVAAVALAAGAYLMREQYPDESFWGAIAAPIALVLALVWQRIRPVLEYQFVMRTAGNETETVTTFDRAQVLELREAIESAFRMQYVQLEQARNNGAGTRDEPEQGLHITRDWVVANVDLAPR